MARKSPMILYANHARFSDARPVYCPRVESRLCLWSKGGKGTVIVNGETHALRAGDYLFLPWGASIRYLPDPQAPFFLAGIHLIPDFDWRETPIDYRVAHQHGDPLAGSPRRRDTELSGLTGLVQYHIQSESPLMLLSEAIVAHFLSAARCEEQLARFARSLLQELTNAEDIRHMPESLRSLLAHIDDNLSAPLSSSDLAGHLKISASQVRRLFRKWLNASPVEYINRKRMERARRLLSSTRLPVSEVAERLGFEDSFYFSRVFKKYIDLSPQAYRRASGFL